MIDVLELSEAERQLLLVLGRAVRRGTIADQPGLEHVAAIEFGVPLDWSRAFATLTEKGLLDRDDTQYLLTEQGEKCRQQVHIKFPYWRYIYDAYHAQAEGSAAHAAFCERVYGRNLCQHGLADMEQLEVLIEVLALDRDSRVLDLGCGNGMTAEYISDVTGAQITGIDISPVGIRQAQARTAHKRDRLAFVVGNIGALDLAPASFDALILIDTIYFVNARRVLEQMERVLRPGGQMGILFSQWIRPGEPRECLRPEGTTLARALRECGLTFWTWDFSAQEIAHWKKKLDVLAKIRPAFEAEGNTWLYEFRLGEAKKHASTIGPNTRSRYLYLVPL
jgi:SAM-dependent methyltransferase